MLFIDVVRLTSLRHSAKPLAASSYVVCFESHLGDRKKTLNFVPQCITFTFKGADVSRGLLATEVVNTPLQLWYTSP